MMKRNVKTLAGIGGFVVVAAILVAAIVTSAGGNLDVVGKDSAAAFDRVLQTLPSQVAADETNVGWSLSAPDDSARFIWSEDYSKAPAYDVMLAFDAQPFVEAGLDPRKLPARYLFDEDGRTLTIGTKLGSDSPSYDGAPTPLAAYEQIVQRYRGSINYHMAMDHFGVKLGGGNLFEWAKDMRTDGLRQRNQDKDIVFVLSPEPLIEAGVDPEKVNGWAYGQVTVEENGKMVDVWKFLKSFDLMTIPL